MLPEFERPEAVIYGRHPWMGDFCLVEAGRAAELERELDLIRGCTTMGEAFALRAHLVHYQPPGVPETTEEFEEFEVTADTRYDADEAAAESDGWPFNPAFLTADVFDENDLEAQALLDSVSELHEPMMDAEYLLIPESKERELVEGLQALHIEVRREDSTIASLG